MNFLDRLKQELVVDEGMRLKPYRCPAGRLTIGVGRNLEDKGITPKEAYYLLANDIEEVLEDMETRVFQGLWRKMPENIRLVLANMRFNLGPSRFRGFKKMIAAARAGNWPEMRREMMDSKWYGEVGGRSVRLIEMVDEVTDRGE